MFASTLFTALFCAGLVVAHDGQTHGHLQPREETNETNTVEITTFGRSQNSTGGQAQVAAAGDLSPFGEIGVGCGINWQEDVSFGGGLQAGSSSFGLGGGYKIFPHSMEIGAGIGYTKSNASASITFQSSDDGSFQLTFTSTRAFACVPGNATTGYSVTCTTTNGTALHRH
ncbi:unnamed protein product [Zymoseptoria tritici ST99CH_1E4]|uniref:Outer membrane protein beta-barrel domain-containing protein n=1 Tax=Zymoseptoria tritici ST99CH_1E4 TaxID=1276532 RepID=A0A2H1GKD0_ZYMTR|nr:unnamed protein product [Zymoseptoria tritici ST99CH_1E4]